MKQNRSIGGYILAGGCSRRMGGHPKETLIYRDKTFLQIQMELFRTWDACYISVSKDSTQAGGAYVRDEMERIGPMGAVYTGLRACKEGALCVVPCDLMGIRPSLLEQLRRRYLQTGRAVFLKQEGRIQPFPGIYTKEMLPLFQDFIRQGEYGVTRLLQKYSDAEWLEMKQTGGLKNINSPADYQKLLQEKEEMKYDISLKEAQEKIKNCIGEQTEFESVPIEKARGRILACDFFARQNQPPFPRSPFDGYAFAACDSKGASRTTPVLFRVAGKVTAGAARDIPIQKRECIRIMTGAPIPKSCDTVVKQEETNYGETQVEIYKEQKPYENYCPEGEDFREGECLLKKGTRLEAYSLAVLAANGVDKVAVRRRIKVGILTTGEELVPVGVRLDAGKIYNAGMYFVRERLEELGAEIVFCENVSDSEEMLENRLRELEKDVDWIVTTGGVSVGEKDVVRPVLEAVGAQIQFQKIQVKPGSPTLFALWGEKLWFALSGNPYGIMVHTEILLRTAVAAYYGCRSLAPVEEQAELSHDYRKKIKGIRFVRGTVEDGKIVLETGKDKAGMISSLGTCNCMVKLEEKKEPYRKGDKAWVIRIRM